MSLPENAIEVHDLVKVYRPRSGAPVTALDGLNVNVRRGEIFGLLGRNGAGKTTLLRILTTLMPPTSGSVTVLGRDIEREGLEIRRNMCVVLQENAVELFLSVEDNLSTYARFHAIPPDQIRGRADRVTERFGLSEYRRQKVIDLSGGLKRRVQVAKVFMVEKPLVFLDEPTTGMDPINKRATLDAIREQALAGGTIFLTTHILEEAEELCDTIAIVDKGKLLALGDLPTIKSLIPSALDISITFELLTDEILADLRRLPFLTFSRKRNTIDACIRSDDLSLFQTLARLAQSQRVLHFEVRSATLEDVFLELLSGPPSPDRPDRGRIS